MLKNSILDVMMNRKSIRKYTDKQPSEEELITIVRAGQQAPFAYQLCSLLLSRNRKRNPFGASWLFTICVDSHRLERIMELRKWQLKTNDLLLLLFGIQDASLLSENMVIAGESLGLGSCFIGNTPYRAASIIKKYKLPQRVFPLVQLAMGYPAEDPPTRPRYPLGFTLFEDEYPDLDEKTVNNAMMEMDDGFLAQDYYRKINYIIPLDESREESFDFSNYSWTEHISRKAGLWEVFPDELLNQFANCGFQIPGKLSSSKES